MSSLAYAYPIPIEPEHPCPVSTSPPLRAVPEPAAPPPTRPPTGGTAMSESDIPDPENHAIAKLAIYALEILQGTRSLTQLSNTVSPEVVAQLLARRALWTERRTLYRDYRRVVPWPGRVRVGRPLPHIAEAVVIVHTEVRALAVAIRLEFFRERWRATDLTVL